nr:MAG TPA: Inosine-5'-monophosphate dehydrogenase [Caudoviricetes sp.]
MYGYGCGGWLPPIAPLTIPGIYSDTLSYEDNLAQIMKKINELVEQVNNLSNGVNNYTDEQIKKLRLDIEKEISALEKTLLAFVSDFEKEISRLEKETDKKVQDLYAYIDSEILKTNNKIKELKNYIDTQIFNAEKRQIKYTDNKVGVESIKREAQDEFLNNKIENVVKDFPKVYNAVLGVKSNVQDTFNSFYEYLRELGVLSISYDKMEMTAEQYDKMELEAHVFDVYSGFIFSESLSKIFSPFTGKKENMSKVLYELIERARWNADTSKYFDEKTSTVQNMDASNYTAKEYEFFNINSTKQDGDFNLKNRRYISTSTVWKKENENTTQGAANSAWETLNNIGNSDIISFSLIIGRKGKKEQINIVNDLTTGEVEEFDITDFTCNNEKQVAYTRHVKIGLADAENGTDNTFNFDDCTANSLSYTDLSHESYVANDNLVMYELRVNYYADSINNL